jgi:hypothetical protein
VKTAEKAPARDSGESVIILILPKNKLCCFVPVKAHLTSTMRHPKNYSKNFGQTTEQLIYVFG